MSFVNNFFDRMVVCRESSSALRVQGKRLQWLDASKGISIILVMMAHSCGFPVGTMLALSGFVLIFFVYSGFTYKQGSFHKLMKKKTLTLLIPYFFYGLLSILVLSIYSRIIGRNDDVLLRVAGLFYSRYSLFPINEETNIYFLKGGLDPMWFLTCMFTSFIWVWIFFKLKDRWMRMFLFVLYAALPIFLTTFTPILLPWSIDCSFLCALLIIVGYNMNKHWGITQRSVRLKWWSFIILFLLFFVLTYLTGLGNISVGQYGRYGVLAIFSFLLIGVLRSTLLDTLMRIIENSWISKVLSFFGRHSLRLMCLHMPIFTIIGVDGSNGGGRFLLSFFAIILALFISFIFEKIKVYFSPKVKFLNFI